MVRLALSYERRANELYETPAWVTLALLSKMTLSRHLVEPACGTGKIAAVLFHAGHVVFGNDIVDYGSMHQNRESDFLTWRSMPEGFGSVCGNPPYGRGAAKLAQRFIEHALGLTRMHSGQVAMLLPADYDHAAGRAGLFGHPAFAGQVKLQRRIRWIEGSTGSPSQNHSWFVWDWRHRGLPFVLYADGREQGSGEWPASDAG